jgi:hypothetical protein
VLVDGRQLPNQTRHVEFRHRNPRVHRPQGFQQYARHCPIAKRLDGITGIASADQAAKALEPLAGSFAFVLFTAGFIGTGLLAIPVLSGSAAYALAEFTGLKGTLAEKPKYRPTFYAVIVLATVAGVALNLLHIDVISALFYTAVIKRCRRAGR